MESTISTSDGLGLKTTVHASFSVWTSKPGADQHGRMAEMEGMWCHYEACIEVKKSYEGGVSIRCFYKKMDHSVPTWAYIEVISVGVFPSFVRDHIYMALLV